MATFTQRESINAESRYVAIAYLECETCISENTRSGLNKDQHVIVVGVTPNGGNVNLLT